MKYSKDGLCRFDPVTHSYFVGKTQLTGVTTFISRYKNKFDAEKIATEYVLKHGGDKDELIKKWKKEGELSCIAGTAVHDVLENYIINGAIKLSGKHQKEMHALKFIIDFFKTGRLKPVEAEVVVYNNKLASMIDCIAVNHAGEYFILDWKTNKKIETNSYGKIMLAPFEFMPDCNYSHYSLQLNIYKQLYKDHEIAGMYVVHFTDESYNFIKIQDYGKRIIGIR